MEEVLPPETQRGAGFEPTRVRQFTIFLENRVGRLTLLVRALEERVGQIVALAIEESADSALVRVTCADPEGARGGVICADREVGRDALRSEGFSFWEVDVRAVELPRKTRQPLIAICA